MKIEVKPNKNIFGKKKGYIASFGSITVTGNTKEEVKKELTEIINWYFETDFWYPPTDQAGDTIFIMIRDIRGYSLQLIDKNTGKKGCSTLYGRITEEEAKDHFAEYIRQYKEAIGYKEVI